MRTAYVILLAAALGTGATAAAAPAAVPGSTPARPPTAVAPQLAPTPPRCTITGTAGNDVLRGTNRNDVICGLGGNDTLVGAGGRDILLGGPGKDVLDGAGGLDVLVGGADVDRLTGGAGSDTCAIDPADVHTDACSIDTGGPVVSAVDVPTSQPAGERLTLAWSASDPSGVTNTNLFLGGPSGWVRWCGFGTPGVLTSGDSVSGTYTVSCDVPADAVTATYSVFVGGADTLGNQTSTALGEFEITGGSGDSASPVVSDLSLPTSVQPGRTVTLTWRATDETGVDSVFPWISGSDGNLIGPDGVFYASPLSNAAERVSGTPTDGVYRTTLSLSATIPAGSYIVRFTSRDVLGNHTYDPYLDGQGREVGFSIPER